MLEHDTVGQMCHQEWLTKICKCSLIKTKCMLPWDTPSSGLCKLHHMFQVLFVKVLKREHDIGMISTDSCHLLNSYRLQCLSSFNWNLHEINILKFVLILPVAKYLRVSDNLSAADIASRMHVFLLLISGDAILSNQNRFCPFSQNLKNLVDHPMPVLWLMHGMLQVPFVCLTMVFPMFFYVFYGCLNGRQSLISVHK